MKDEIKSLGYMTEITQPTKHAKVVNALRDMIKYLCIDTREYDPENTIIEAQKYIEYNYASHRILYSEISSFIFAAGQEDCVRLEFNLMKLINAVNRVDMPVDCVKMLVKIYDHSMLVLNQIENASNISAISAEEVKTKFDKEVKGMEKEYISILGIFAAIVLTFVGGITFSSAVLQSMLNVSMYRLITVTILLAFVIWLLIKFILTINCFSILVVLLRV